MNIQSENIPLQPPNLGKNKIIDFQQPGVKGLAVDWVLTEDNIAK